MAYRFIDRTQAARELCKAHGKWGLYISFPDLGAAEWDDFKRAAPYFNIAWGENPPQDDNNAGQCLFEGTAIILCDTEEEMNDLYDQTVGDDGPTEKNSYNGPMRVYALTISPEGEFRNENT